MILAVKSLQEKNEAYEPDIFFLSIIMNLIFFS